jgi:hypothetical protein
MGVKEGPYLDDLLRCHLALGVGTGRDPSIGQEFRKPIDGLGWQPLQDAFNTCKHIYFMMFSACDLALQGRRRSAAPITPDKHGILSTDGLST